MKCVMLNYNVYTVNGTLVASFREKFDAKEWIRTRLEPNDYYME